MKNTNIKFITGIFFIMGLTVLIISSCRGKRLPLVQEYDTLKTNMNGNGDIIELSFTRGPEHNHPLMAVWTEDTAGNYIQTLYVANSIAKGYFEHGDKSTGRWLAGPIKRPAALPVWAHSRGVKEADGLYMPSTETAIPDAYTGATPKSNFILIARTDEPLPRKFIILFEINQTWDWNEYWTNNKFPGDENYKTSCQPALVYAATLDKEQPGAVELRLLGHSHYSGMDGKIYEDLSSITTAREITGSLSVKITP